MPDNKKVMSLERVGSKSKIVKIKFIKEVPATRSAAYIAAAFNKCFKHSIYKIIIDMENINSSLHNNFIATIIEATTKVRRQKGDIKIINLSELAEQAFTGFNAFSYLTITPMD